MLLTENMIEVFIINGDDKDNVKQQIDDFKKKIDDFLPVNSFGNGNGVEMKGFPSKESGVRFAENSVCVLLFMYYYVNS